MEEERSNLSWFWVFFDSILYIFNGVAGRKLNRAESAFQAVSPRRNGRVCAWKELFADGAVGNVDGELAVGLLEGRVEQQRAVLPAMLRV